MKILRFLPSAKHTESHSNDELPQMLSMPTKPATRNMKPMCIITKYANAARNTSARSASNRISRNEAIVINSHAKRKRKLPSAMTTNIIDNTNTTNAV